MLLGQREDGTNPYKEQFEEAGGNWPQMSGISQQEMFPGVNIVERLLESDIDSILKRAFRLLDHFFPAVCCNCLCCTGLISAVGGR